MAKFAVIEIGKTSPLNVFEGDFIETYPENDLVKVMRNARDRNSSDTEVAVVKLKPGLTVQEIN